MRKLCWLCQQQQQLLWQCLSNGVRREVECGPSSACSGYMMLVLTIVKAMQLVRHYAVLHCLRQHCYRHLCTDFGIP